MFRKSVMFSFQTSGFAEDCSSLQNDCRLIFQGLKKSTKALALVWQSITEILMSVIYFC